MGRLQPKDDVVEDERLAGRTEALDDAVDQDGAISEDFHTEDEEDDEEAGGVVIDDEDDEDEDEEDDDDNEDEDEAEDNDLGVVASTSAPLLPKHLLEAEPLSEDTALQAIVLTRKQKRAQSAKDRKAKRQMYVQIRRDARGSGVLEAGAAAQVRRGLALGENRVASGRVQKKRSQSSQPVQSGRQQVLEKRKRGESAREEGPLATKRKSRRRAR